ncbi:MAG TPA: 3-dehydroquinate synthase, partial [Cytophagaceae bacterium]
MSSLRQSFRVQYEYTVHFTTQLFDLQNQLLLDVVKNDGNTAARKIIFIVDDGVSKNNPELTDQIEKYINNFPQIFRLVSAPLIFPGGEEIKNESHYYETVIEAINEYGIDRHSYVAAIGGGAILDMVGFASAISHRGIRHIRIPSTVLSQNDSGVGVKNSINAFNKKNFLGTFVPPFAVINDYSFLESLPDRDWVAGISEAIKVALIKDDNFFNSIAKNTQALLKRNRKAMENLIFRCAKLHLNHIAGKDPFEKGSSRPLDFGHWSAHKLEQLSSYSIRHGEAVAAGIALDTTYSYLKGLIQETEWNRIITVISNFGFALYYDEYLDHETVEEDHELLKGLNEFREH